MGGILSDDGILFRRVTHLVTGPFQLFPVTQFMADFQRADVSGALLSIRHAVKANCEPSKLAGPCCARILLIVWHPRAIGTDPLEMILHIASS